MQLRCTYCQTMFAISQEEMLAGLEHMEEHKQTYYDAHCPKCRRANRVERARMERFFPDWKKAIKTMEKATAQAEKPAPETSVKAGAASKAKPSPAAGKTAAKTPAKAGTTPKAKPSPAAKKPAGAKKK
jgi:predicted  nucleic acid-binding Zn-ribbon protein